MKIQKIQDEKDNVYVGHYTQWLLKKTQNKRGK